MKLDIVFVTYNSTKWIDGCLNSILKSNYDFKKISLYFYDNNSTDNTVDMLEKYKCRFSNQFNDFMIIKGKKNKGFGHGNNVAAKYGKSDYLLFLNIDTEIFDDTFLKLEKEILLSNKKVKVWELKQTPYEHPKYFDPYTQYTSWASGACVIFDRIIFEKIKGFDTSLFMYSEDVEISWNVRKHGYYIKYLSNVAIKHFSYIEPGQFKKNQYIYGIVNNLYLRYKYGNIKNMIKGNILIGKRFIKKYLNGIVSESEENNIQSKIRHEYIKMQFKGIKAIFINIFSIKKNDFKPKFIDFDYEVNKLGGFYVDKSKNEHNNSLVSVIVRTCGRPAILYETLVSLRKQEYKNIEIVIVEDGEPISKKMIDENFNDLNILYYATEKKVGRSKVGNIGMKIANGKYLNFLDDDDLFYPDHVSILANELMKTKYKVAYTTAFETSIEVKSKDPYNYKVKGIAIRHFGEFNLFTLFRKNITPIQSVMFEKEVFENCGGFDQKIDALEDWDLWIRFAIKYKFKYIDKTTSLYRVPAHPIESKEREKFLCESLDYLKNKFRNYKIEISVEDVYDSKI